MEYLSVKKVAERYGENPATVWRRLQNNPAFPRPVKLSPGCTRWRLADLLAWEVTLQAA
ncbi:AlpA family phage regulatory protein [Paracoccus sp. DMF-8]|uniref:helix-turn-helix transcriptional regulator n=1 Tax=Paracoccus sp. DMF-8 TaxID=3019445 RepID=UPI0023E45AC2|nr:AlpA family phage regulatory protein [Paracoccus sp. DMF-8]MDF3607914.1 AlpA family phage regulatory protein [Paracoccus sp. DMF-8]